MTGTEAEARPHIAEIIQGVVVDSEYPVHMSVGREVYVVRCSCGWSAQRQLLPAARSQLDKHRTAVTA